MLCVVLKTKLTTPFADANSGATSVKSVNLDEHSLPYKYLPEEDAEGGSNGGAILVDGDLLYGCPLSCFDGYNLVFDFGGEFWCVGYQQPG